MKKSSFNFTYFLREGFWSIFSHGLMSFAAVCMIVCCLLIMGSFSLVAINVDTMLGHYEDSNEFIAYVDDSYTQEQALALESRISSIENVREIEFVFKEDALDTFLETAGDSALFEDLPSSVLRDRYIIRVDDLSLMQETTAQVEVVPGIADVSATYEIAEGFVVIRNIATMIALILVVVLLLVSLFIIANTIKLAAFTRREEISIMKMCGATDGFVRWPFVFEGLILGLMGAIVAFLLQWGLYDLVGTAIIQSDTLQLLTVQSFGPMALHVFGAFLGLGAVIGSLGSVLAIGKFLQV